MAASADPSGNNHEQQPPNNGSGGGDKAASNPNNGNSAATGAPENSPAVGKALKHNPGIALEWNAEEQAILDDGLTKYASEASILRYAKIARQLPNKTVRDVALRCRWMSKKEVSKRRKEEGSRKSKDKREKVTDPSSKSSHPASRPTVPSSSSLQTVSVDNDDGISYKAIGGPVGELLEQNAQAFEQISANFSSHQIQENISLLCQAWENITKIMNSLSESPEIMKQMPPLPEKLNEELANSILPRRP
ncbi:hypothetical protein Dimus_028390 [Dionaea muscipula]